MKSKFFKKQAELNAAIKLLDDLIVKINKIDSEQHLPRSRSESFSRLQDIYQTCLTLTCIWSILSADADSLHSVDGVDRFLASISTQMHELHLMAASTLSEIGG